MKRLTILILFTVLSLGVHAQFWITGVTFNPTTPSTCDNVTATVSGGKVCGNSVITHDSTSFNGGIPTIHVNDQLGPICLPVIATFTLPVTIGNLSAGYDTVTVKYYQNGLLTETHDFTILVSNSGNVIHDTLSICQGDSIQVYGNWQSQVGIYSDTIPASTCDTIKETYLMYSSLSEFYNTINICQGDSAFIKKVWRKTSGQFIDSISSSLFCDSTIITTLIVGANKNDSNNVVICQGSSYFTGIRNLTEAGIYYDTLSTWLNCDSVIISNLSVNRRDTLTIDAQICLGEVFYAGGTYQATSGAYFDYYSNVFGCDSLQITNLDVNLTFVSSSNDTICDGENYQFQGQMFSNAGFYFDSLQSVNGCDSVYTLNLAVKQTKLVSNDTTACLEDSLILFGNLVNTTSTVSQVFVGTNGCDSTYSYDVVIYQPDTSEFDTLICDHDSLLFNGMYLSSAGNYYQFYSSVFGCDSVHELVMKTETCVGLVSSAIQFKDKLIFPNPTIDYLNITEQIDHVESIVISDLIGKEVLGMNQITSSKVDISTLPNGIYLIKLITKEGFTLSKFIISR
jgi:hypothetical protein|tara:strand:- start:611 stop:2314 length:1704 start_codon:yes stop_codon:yes gene_type:complete